MKKTEIDGEMENYFLHKEGLCDCFNVCLYCETHYNAELLSDNDRSVKRKERSENEIRDC